RVVGTGWSTLRERDCQVPRWRARNRDTTKSVVAITAICRIPNTAAALRLRNELAWSQISVSMVDTVPPPITITTPKEAEQNSHTVAAAAARAEAKAGNRTCHVARQWLAPSVRAAK